MKRSGPIKSRPKRRSVEEKNASEAWGTGPLPLAQCNIAYSVTDKGEDRVTVQRHHAIPRQQCRKYGAPEWDTRNRMLITKRRHERHHSGHETLHASELPPSVREFAAEFGLDAWCERHIPGWEASCTGCGAPVRASVLCSVCNP